MDTYTMYAIDVALVALVVIVILVLLFWKKSKYQREAMSNIRAEIRLPTGWSEIHLVPFDQNAKTITIDNILYRLNDKQRKWGMHPLNPFLGLTWTQSPIRIETWDKDNPEPIHPIKEGIICTGAEINAITKEIQATAAAMMIQEIASRQHQLEETIANQPNKIVTYILAGGAFLFSLINLIVYVASNQG